MTDKEKDTVLFLQIARDLKVTETTIGIGMVKTLYDLINRLQAENERLTTLAKLGNMRANDYREMRDKLKKANAEIERLNKEVDRLSQCVLYHDGIVSDLEKDVFNAKAEAIKEFAERLKNKSKLLVPSVYKKPFRAVSVDDIDNLVNQITESECEENVSKK